MPETDLKAIQEAVVRGEYQYTLHALRRIVERHISRLEIEQAVACAELIEDYPQDKYGPSCLLYGQTSSGRPLHILATCPPPMVKIVTAYEPDPDEWENNRVRKRK